jgi:hypothetical protein
VYLHADESAKCCVILLREILHAEGLFACRFVWLVGSLVGWLVLGWLVG